jgi:hypothetical protein
MSTASGSVGRPPSLDVLSLTSFIHDSHSTVQEAIYNPFENDVPIPGHCGIVPAVRYLTPAWKWCTVPVHGNDGVVPAMPPPPCQDSFHPRRLQCVQHFHVYLDTWASKVYTNTLYRMYTCTVCTVYVLEWPDNRYSMYKARKCQKRREHGTLSLINLRQRVQYGTPQIVAWEG